MTRDELLAFLGGQHRAVMTTNGLRGWPHAVPVLYALDAGTILISGTAGRVRTRHLEHDPRCTITVFDEANWWRWVTVEGTCQIRRDDGPRENLRLYEMITGKPPDDVDEYLEAMVRERRLVYAIAIDRWYPSG